MDFNDVFVYLGVLSHLLPISVFRNKGKMGLLFMSGLFVDVSALLLSKSGIPNLWLFGVYMSFMLLIFTQVFNTSRPAKIVALVLSAIAVGVYPLKYFYDSPLNYVPVIQLDSILIVVYLTIYLFRYVFKNKGEFPSALKVKLAMLFVYYHLFVALVFSSNSRDFILQEFSIGIYIVFTVSVLLVRNGLAFVFGRKHKEEIELL